MVHSHGLIMSQSRMRHLCHTNIVWYVYMYLMYMYTRACHFTSSLCTSGTNVPQCQMYPRYKCTPVPNVPQCQMYPGYKCTPVPNYDYKRPYQYGNSSLLDSRLNTSSLVARIYRANWPISVRETSKQLAQSAGQPISIQYFMYKMAVMRKDDAISRNILILRP